MKAALLTFALILPLQAAAAVNDLYQVKADKTIGCMGPTAKRLSQAKASPNASLPEDCRFFKSGFRFSFQQANSYSFVAGDDRINPGHIENTVYAEWLDSKADGGAEYATFDARDVEPVLDSRGQPVQASCSAPAGGEYDRLEVGKDGRLYLKRYEFTSKCVNGQMRQVEKRLN